MIVRGALGGGVILGLLTVVVLLRSLLPPLADRLHAIRVGGDVTLLEADFGKIFSRVPLVVAQRLEEELSRFLSSFLRTAAQDFDLSRVEVGELGLTIDLWESQEELARYYQSIHRDDFSNNGGYYDPSSRTIALVAGADYDSLRRAVFHEATHLIFDLFASGRGGRFPRWLGEGLAVYFEGAVVEGGEVRVGGREALTPELVALARLARHGHGLGEGPGPELPDLDDLLASEPQNFRSETNVLYYAQSAFLVHFLLEEAGPDVRQAFLDLCRRPEVRTRTTRSLARALHLAPEELEGSFSAFLGNLLR